ncbi:MAG: multidrug DMT transporter permease [Ferruginibacter sp.]|nr:multidrug DMT transporter permease [Cytophagales bacterium]
MVIVQSYSLCIVLLVTTMFCWGSWANTQKLASREWNFQLFYWDYALGVLLLSLFFAFTLGSTGQQGRGFLPDLAQADAGALGSAFLGGVVFNLANILLVAAIDVAGLALAFPVGIGLALVLGVLVNYVATPLGNPVFLFVGVALVSIAILLNATAYRKKQAADASRAGRPSPAGGPGKGIVLSLVAGILMSSFYRFVAASMAPDFVMPEAGRLTPYTALVVFSLGLFASNFVWNTYVMARPFSGKPVRYADYFRKGNPRLHLIGMLGGAIWFVGMAFSIMASGEAGFAISYGLGQGATMVAAFWGVFVWREFRNAPAGTNSLLSLMFLSFLSGLALIIYARYA